MFGALIFALLCCVFHVYLETAIPSVNFPVMVTVPKKVNGVYMNAIKALSAGHWSPSQLGHFSAWETASNIHSTAGRVGRAGPDIWCPAYAI